MDQRDECREELAREIERRFRDTVFIVEATEQEQQDLWLRWNTVLSFETVNPGVVRRVGYLDVHEIWVGVTWRLIEGSLVAFYTPTSRVVDHNIVERWASSTFSAMTDGSRRRQCDAMNFHQCLGYIAPKWTWDERKKAQYDRIHALMTGDEEDDAPSDETKADAGDATDNAEVRRLERERVAKNLDAMAKSSGDTTMSAVYRAAVALVRGMP